MTHEPTLAVLITYHDEGTLLTECLQSLFQSDVKPDEILIYDDCSKDPAEKYIATFSNVRVLRGEKNLGPSAGRNILLKEAKSELIHFHDADDWFFRGWVEQVKDVFKNEPCDAYFTEVSSYNERKEKLCDRVIGLVPLSSTDALTHFCIRNFMLVPSGTYRRSLVQELRGYRTDLWQSEDYDFHVRMSLTNPKVKVSQEPLVGIRIRTESRSQNKFETHTCTLNALKRFEKEVPKQFHSSIAEKASEMGAELFRMGYRKEARDAFAFAKRLGPPHFQRERKFYQVLARLTNQEIAEWFGLCYRNFLPLSFRRAIRTH